MTDSAVAILDASGVVVSLSESVAEVLECEKSHLLGHALVDAVTLTDADGTDTSWPTPGHRDVAVVATAKGGTGEGIPLLVRIRELDAGESGHHRLVSLRRGDAEGSDEPSAIEVISTVSHELRSPLTSVKGYTSLLLKRWDRLKDEQKQMMLQQVHHDADRVTRLVTELLDISRIETGRLNLRRQMVDIPALASSVVDKLGVTYDELDCTLDFPDDFPQLYVDPDKIEQVLTNLVENPTKYANPVGMQLTGSVDGDLASVAVIDKGEGIPEDDLPRVFQKFFRREIAQPSGTGLGLWISRGLVEAHGGDLVATSAMGAGSTFRFTCPVNAFEEIHGAEAGS